MLINYNKRQDKYYKMLKHYYDYAQDVLQLPTPDIEVNVALVNASVIKRLNREFRQVDKVTDVLSFPTLDGGKNKIICSYLTKENFIADINMETGNIMLGDIYICLKKVKQQAKEYGHSLEREFCYLGVHGLLHLMGYDHMVDEEKAVMRDMEEKILGGLK